LALAGASLLLFSRLVIWATVLSAVLVHVVLGLIGQSNPITYYVLDVCLLVMLVRSPFFFFFLCFLASTMRMAERSTQTAAPETPTYDPQTDQLVFRSGRREPAFLNPPKAKREPESAAEYYQRRDEDFQDKRDKDFFEDLHKYQDRERRARDEDSFRN
jgi:hypothetical protein